MDQFVIVLIFIALAAAGGVLLVRQLLPAQRLVAMAGLLAVAAQVYYPPCLEMGPDGHPRPAGRRMLNRSAMYSPSDVMWVDAGRQTASLATTVIATVAVCGLLKYGRARRPTVRHGGQTPPDGPSAFAPPSARSPAPPID